MIAPIGKSKPAASTFALELGARLRELRGIRSQKAFAEAQGIGFTTYRRYEVGEREPEPSLLLRIAQSERVSPTWLLAGTGSKSVTPEVFIAQELEMRDAVLGDVAAGKYREAIVRDAMTRALKTHELDLERMQDCIQVLAELVEKQGRMMKPEKFARACVLLYEMSAVAGSAPNKYSVNRLLETID